MPVANLNKKIYELSDGDLAKLAAVRQYRDCPSDVEALRHCIRETYKLDLNRVHESIAVKEMLGPEYDEFVAFMKRRDETQQQ